MSSTVRNRNEDINPESDEQGVKRDTALFLARFNSPELLQRRSVAIAQANAGRTKESDDALEKILKDFESLSF